MRILVTGGAGFIGSHLADRFVADGHDVVALDDLSSGKAGQVNARARLVVADVRSKAARAAVLAFAPEVVCHHAAQMDVRRSVVDPAFDADVNLVGLNNVVEAARQGGALAHVLFASSGGAMYGEQETYPAPESHPTRPESPYGLAKAASTASVTRPCATATSMARGRTHMARPVSSPSSARASSTARR